MPYSSLATRIPNGVNNCDTYQAMAQSGIPDPSFSQLFMEDFNVWRPADWTTTLVGTGTSAALAGQGGLMQDVTTAGIADGNSHQLPAAGFQLIPGTHHFFKIRFSLDNATLSAFFAGLIATSTTPQTAADGLFFQKPAGAAQINLVHKIGGVVVTTPLPLATSPMPAGTMTELSFHVDNLGNVEVFYNPTTGVFTQPAIGAAKGRIALLPASSLPSGITQALLNPTFGLVNSTAVSRSMTTDYICVSSEI